MTIIKKKSVFGVGECVAKRGQHWLLYERIRYVRHNVFFLYYYYFLLKTDSYIDGAFVFCFANLLAPKLAIEM